MAVLTSLPEAMNRESLIDFEVGIRLGLVGRSPVFGLRDDQGELLRPFPDSRAVAAAFDPWVQSSQYPGGNCRTDHSGLVAFWESWDRNLRGDSSSHLGPGWILHRKDGRNPPDHRSRKPSSQYWG